MLRTFTCSLVVLASLFALTACGGSGGDDSGSSSPTTSVTSYRATATVGDFILIDIDHAAGTIAYDNISNGESGTVSFTENADGSYTVATPGGDRLAFEVEGFGMVLEMHDTGPGGTTPSLVIAVAGNDPVTLDQLRNREVNVMQFRTVGDGIEVGHASTDAGPQVANTAHLPSEPPSSNFQSSTMPAGSFSVDPSGDWVIADAGGGDISYVVTTPSGIFFIDNPNGAQVAFPETAGKAFDPTHAGTYRTIVYEKKNASSPAPGAPEGGTAQFLFFDITISASGTITVTDPATGSVKVGGLALTPVADDTDLYDGSTAKLQDPCHGMFVFQAGPGEIGPSQKAFVVFTDDALAVASYEDNGDGTYNYFYGFAMEVVPPAITRHVPAGAEVSPAPLGLVTRP